MRIVEVKFGRLLFAVAALASLSFACSSNSDSSTRGGEGGAQSDVGAVSWCAAYKIINCFCQQCHQNPPLNSAPVPLVTYTDTQAPFPQIPGRKVWEEMLIVIRERSMPYTGDTTVMPPVKPLTDEQQNTLLTWLQQGAHDVGGQGCPQSCDWTKRSQ